MLCSETNLIQDSPKQFFASPALVEILGALDTSRLPNSGGSSQDLLLLSQHHGTQPKIQHRADRRPLRRQHARRKRKITPLEITGGEQILLLEQSCRIWCLFLNFVEPAKNSLGR